MDPINNTSSNSLNKTNGTNPQDPTIGQGQPAPTEKPPVDQFEGSNGSKPTEAKEAPTATTAPKPSRMRRAGQNVKSAASSSMAAVRNFFASIGNGLAKAGRGIVAGFKSVIAKISSAFGVLAGLVVGGFRKGEQKGKEEAPVAAGNGPEPKDPKGPAATEENNAPKLDESKKDENKDSEQK